MENYLINYQSYIYSAILKYGHSNFSLTILEYCEPEQCLQREDFYLSSLPHKYNILEKAGSRIGSKHSDATKQIMSDAAKKIDHPSRFKPGENHPNFGKARYEGAGSPSQKIEVTDIINNTTTSYDSISAAARALNIKKSTITNYILRNQKKPYKGIYTFKIQ